MLRFELLPGRNILVVIPEGPLEQADFEQFARQVDPLIASAGSIAGLMIEARVVPRMAEFRSIRVASQVCVDHHRRIERIAVANQQRVSEVVAARRRLVR